MGSSLDQKTTRVSGSIWATRLEEKSVFGQFTKLTGLLLALLLLGGCARTPYQISLGVINEYPSPGEDINTYCTDALEASLVLQGIKVESGQIAPGKTTSVDLIVPEGANPGTLLITEAWCYRDGEEVGYALVEKPYEAPRIPAVDVLPPPTEGSSEIAGCVELTETRGVPICIVGDPYN